MDNMTVTAQAATIAALTVEQDMARASLRGRIHQLEQALYAAGVEPPADGGQGMAAAYHAQARAIAAVLEYFDAGNYTLDGLPPELHDAFRPLLVT